MKMMMMHLLAIYFEKKNEWYIVEMSRDSAEELDSNERINDFFVSNGFAGGTTCCE